MKRFQFPLERVRRVFAARLGVDEALLESAIAGLRAEESSYARARSAEQSFALQTLAQAVITAEELAQVDSLGEYRKRETARLELLRREAGEKIARLRSQVLFWRRKLELLDRLRERQKVDWDHEEMKELQELADEAFLSKLMAERREGRSSGRA